MAFKNTILGKILKGAAKVAPIGLAVASFIIPGGPIVAGAVGVAKKIAGKVSGSIGGKIVGGIAKTVGAVGKSAVNLISGTTAVERAQVKEVKGEAKEAQDILDQVQRLMKAGATRAKAEQMLGITASELGSANAAQKDEETTKKLDTEDKKPVTAGCAPTVFLIIAALATMAFTIIIL